MTSTLPLPPTNHEPTKLTKLTSTEVQNADQKPATCMPGSIHATSATMPALMTSRNRPRVMMVIGSVSTMAIGRTMELTIPSSTPARIKVPGVSIETPSTQTVASHKPSATMLARIRNPSMLDSCERDVARAYQARAQINKSIVKPGQRRVLGRHGFRRFGNRRTFERHFDARHEALPAHTQAHVGFVPGGGLRDP